MIAILTLSLAMGLSNLAFATLAGVYERSCSTRHWPILLWIGSRAISGVAFMLIWLRPVVVPLLSLTLSHVLLLLAWSLEIAAYASLLGYRGWRVPLLVFTLISLVIQVFLHVAAVPRSIDLIYFSIVNGLYFLAISGMLFARFRRGALVRLMAFTNAIPALMFFVRAIELLWPDLLSWGYAHIDLALWLSGYLVIIINGFGFLLLAKQDDDRELAQALADVSLAEAEQRQLLSLASHEFRTPAAIIQASLDSLRFLSDEIQPAVASRLEHIRGATHRLTHLANALITNDRLRELRIGLESREVRIEALLRQVAGQYPGRVDCQLSTNDLTMHVDPDLLAIAVHNLIDNALRHGAAGGNPRLSLSRANRVVEIRVADCGSGVPDAEKEAIFERFYRRDTGPGSGLGLSIVRTVARLHGGDAYVHDHQPHGSAFVIRLPLSALGCPPERL